jgi:hypothetical protein
MKRAASLFLFIVFITFHSQAHRSGMKTEKGAKYDNTHESVWTKYVPLAQKSKIRGLFTPLRRK